MKIFAPLKNTESIIDLIEAGADEFYCGYVDKKWQDKYGKEVEINRRTFCGSMANFTDLYQLEKTISIAHENNRKVMLALNHHQFINAQLEDVYAYIKEFHDINGDGVILADLNAIEYAKKMGLFVAASTDINIYNAESVKYFYNMGVDRIIISRDLSLQDIESIRNKVPEVEMEVFMINGPCKFSDSLCLALHSTKHGAFCRYLSSCQYTLFGYDQYELSEKEKEMLKVTYRLFLNDYMNFSCGLCAIWKLIRIGVNACKIVGRVLPVERIKKEILLVKNNIKIALNCQTQDEYLNKMIRAFETDQCKHGYQCFYSEKQYFLR